MTFYGGFENGWDGHKCLAFPIDGEPYELEKGNVFNPTGFTTFFRTGGGYGEPEVGLMHRENYPERVAEGSETSVKLFTTSWEQDAGLLAEEEVGAGNTVRVTAQAHAWSNHEGKNFYLCWNCFSGVPIPEGEEWAPCPDSDCETGINRDCELVFPNPHVGTWSEGVGEACARFDTEPEENGKPRQDAKRNISVMVGIDPTGGKNPYADTVVWGDEVWIYNCFSDVSVEVEAESDVITVFLRSKARYAFVHNDVYWDNARLEIVEEQEEPEEYDGEVVKTGAKIGIHTILPNNVKEFASKTNFPVVKFVDDFGWAVEFSQQHPDIITIGRIHWDGEGCQGVGDWNSLQIAAHAERAISTIKEKLAQNPGLRVDYWEPYNEPDPPGVDGYRALANLQIKTMEVAEREGLKLALFSLNAGTPEYDEMQAMAETGVFAMAKQGGHVLALHEGTFNTHDPKYLWGDTIPGSPEVEGAGALNFRYRYLYHVLKQRGEVVPLVVTEWYCGDEQAASIETVVDALIWYEQEASKDFYHLAPCPFTLGPTGQWWHTDYERVYPAIIDYMNSVAGRQNALPPENQMAYKSTTVLIPRGLGWRWGMAAQLGGYQRGYTVAQSAQDPAELAKSDNVITSTVVAVNPEQIGTGLTPEWYQQWYPNVEVIFEPLHADTPYELAVKLLPDLDGDIALRQRDYLADLGEEAGGSTIYDAGCLLSDFGITLRKAYGKDVHSDWLNELLVFADNETNTFTNDNLLDWHGAVSLFPVFDESRKVNRSYSASELRGLLESGWLVTLARSDFEHFVYLESVQGDTLRVIDPWYGERRTWYASQVGGIRAAHLEGAVDPPGEVVGGLHDESGGRWMADNGLSGYCLAHAQVQQSAESLDFTHLGDQIVICRLNWGYADGSGTIPPSEYHNVWVDAMAQTINNANGVWGFVIANELNNPGEWPGGYPNPTYIPSPSIYADLYNRIAERTDRRLAPFSLDPYNVLAQEFGQPGDPADWASIVYSQINRMDFCAIHAKTQGNDPNECWSNATFTHAPLVGRYLHLKTVEDQLSWLPYMDIPVIITELNPQTRYDGTLGWEPDNSEWIKEAFAYLRTQPVDGATLYRYEIAGGNQEGFALEDKPILLDALRKELNV